MNANFQPSESLIKAQAQRLKSFLAEKGCALPHAACLEAIAHQYGHRSWQHLHASTHPAKNRTPKNPSAAKRLPTWSKLIGSFLREQLKPHQDHLAKVALFLTDNRAPVERVDYVNPVRGEDGREHEAVSGVRVAVDQDTVMELTLVMKFFHVDGQLSVQGSVHSSLRREGTGPEDLRGFKLDMVDWGDCSHVGGCSADLASDWNQIIREYLADIPLLDFLSDALPLDPNETFHDLKNRLSTRLEGMSEEDLLFEEITS